MADYSATPVDHAPEFDHSLTPVDHDPFPGGAALGVGSPAETSQQPAGLAALLGGLLGGNQEKTPVAPTPVFQTTTGVTITDQDIDRGINIALAVSGGGLSVKGAGLALPMDEASRAARAAEQGFGDKGLRNVWAGKLLDDPQYGKYPHVIERNKPMEYEWYHGTQAPEFSEFKAGGVKRQTKDWNTMLGPHFSDSPGVASSFAEGLYSRTTEGGRVLPVQLKISNPKVYRSETDLSDDAVRWAVDKGLLTANDFKRGGSDTRGLASSITDGKLPDWAFGFGGEVLQGAGAKRKQIADGFRKELTAAGHDGIVYGNNVEGIATSAAIPFASNQIRSRFAVFDPAHKESGNLLGGLAGVGVASGAAYGLKPVDHDPFAK